MIHIVGAGSGAADLITLRGARLLRAADVVVWAGSLVNPELLAECKESCVVYDSAHMTLEEVLDVMCAADARGEEVVRLHTGDPCLYGAIQEQMDALDARGVDYEVVPGVSSFCGAAAALRQEYTLPGISQSVVITRLSGRTPMPAGEGMRTMAESGSTMVIFLSSGMLAELSAELLAAGRSSDEPAALVYKATWPEERVVRCTVGTLADAGAQRASTARRSWWWAACSGLAAGLRTTARKRSRTSAASFTTLRLPRGIERRAASVAFEHYIYTGTTRLRCGYTTGSCAALAAKAACEMLLSRKPVGRVSIVTPGELPVETDVVDACIGEGCAQCAVRKDAGDDADVTDGVLVYARVEHAGSGTGAAGSKGVPARESEVSVDGGVGVGRVTLPGLEQPVGAAAINATPRAMITSAVREVCAAYGFSGNIAVTISVPEGVALAEKTFNPHLGIEGGISILGTTGIVEPRSLAALRDSIELEIRQHAAMGRRGVVLTPGNYGGQFISGHFHLNGAPVVFISNFVGDAIDCCVREGFTNVLLVGHIGKLVKVAGGIMDTHSRTADCRAEILAAHAALAGAGAKTVREIMSSVTTTAALEVIEAAGVGDAARASLAVAIEDRLRRRAAGACDIAAVVFDAERRELFRTSGADAVIGELGATYE